MLVFYVLRFLFCMHHSAEIKFEGHPVHFWFCAWSESESHAVMSDFLWPQGLYSPWTSPGRNTRAGSLSLLQLIFLTQGLNPGLLWVDCLPTELSVHVCVMILCMFRRNYISISGFYFLFWEFFSEPRNMDRSLPEYK